MRSERFQRRQLMQLLFLCMILGTAFIPCAAYAGGYETAVILAPEADATVHDNQGNLTVTVALTPAIRRDAGDYLLLLMDGAEVARGIDARFELKNIDRGTHRLQLEVRSADGALILASAPVSFQMWRASILFPIPAS